MAATLDQLQALKPTTLPGIKSLAKQLARTTGLQHSHALNAASRQAGHKDWSTALNTLRNESH